jgi:hypothetical protein
MYDFDYNFTVNVKQVGFTYLLMELSASWEAANCAATQELPSVLWNPKVHYRLHKSPPLAHILSQIDPIPKQVGLSDKNKGTRTILEKIRGILL